MPAVSRQEPLWGSGAPCTLHGWVVGAVGRLRGAGWRVVGAGCRLLWVLVAGVLVAGSC